MTAISEDRVLAMLRVGLGSRRIARQIGVPRHVIDGMIRKSSALTEAFDAASRSIATPVDHDQIAELLRARLSTTRIAKRLRLGTTRLQEIIANDGALRALLDANIAWRQEQHAARVEKTARARAEKIAAATGVAASAVQPEQVKAFRIKPGPKPKPAPTRKTMGLLSDDAYRARDRGPIVLSRETLILTRPWTAAGLGFLRE